jgi:hypothetical protein
MPSGTMQDPGSFYIDKVTGIRALPCSAEVCMHACVYVCKCLCIYVCACVFVSMCTCEERVLPCPAKVCARACVYVCECLCIYVCTCLYVYVCIHVKIRLPHNLMYVCTYIWLWIFSEEHTNVTRMSAWSCTLGSVSYFCACVCVQAHTGRDAFMYVDACIPK